MNKRVPNVGDFVKQDYYLSWWKVTAVGEMNFLAISEDGKEERKFPLSLFDVYMLRDEVDRPTKAEKPGGRFWVEMKTDSGKKVLFVCYLDGDGKPTLAEAPVEEFLRQYGDAFL